jgi:hypothetical protein
MVKEACLRRYPILFAIALLATACAHEPKTYTIVVPPAADFEARLRDALHAASGRQVFVDAAAGLVATEWEDAAWGAPPTAMSMRRWTDLRRFVAAIRRSADRAEILFRMEQVECAPYFEINGSRVDGRCAPKRRIYASQQHDLDLLAARLSSFLGHEAVVSTAAPPPPK